MSTRKWVMIDGYDYEPTQPVATFDDASAAWAFAGEYAQSQCPGYYKLSVRRAWCEETGGEYVIGKSHYICVEPVLHNPTLADLLPPQ